MRQTYNRKFYKEGGHVISGTKLYRICLKTNTKTANNRISRIKKDAKLSPIFNGKIFKQEELLRPY